MAHFYGQVRGNAATAATRGGTKASGLTVSAQSYTGSIIVQMRDDRQDPDGEPFVTLHVSDETTGSTWGAREVFRGRLSDLERALAGASC